MEHAPRDYADSPIVQYVRSLPQEFLLAREVAMELNVALTLLNYLARDPERGLGPTHQAAYGSLTLRLYTPERLEKIRAHLAAQGDTGGKPRLFTPIEQLNRRREAQRIRNHINAAKAYRAEGKLDKAARSQATADELQVQFDADRVARCKELGIRDRYKPRKSRRAPEGSVTAGLS